MNMIGSTLTFNDEEQWSPDVKMFEDHPFPTSIIGRIGDELVVRGEAWNDLKELIKPLPIEHLLPEVHHTVEFDSSAAWAAVRALSRGS